MDRGRTLVRLRSEGRASADCESTAIQVFDAEVFRLLWRHTSKLNRQLRAAILELERTEPTVRRSNVGGWQSLPSLFERGEPFALLADRVQRALQWLPPSDANAQNVEWRLAGWANVSRTGHGNSAHNHGSPWVGVYYVSVGESGGGGELHFYRGKSSSSAAEYFELTPQDGMMLIFPGSLWHSVECWHGQTPRISVAFNAWTHTPEP